MFTEINSELFNMMLEKAKFSQRKRSHFNLHKTLDDSVQRLCIALLKGSYIRPHMHKKNELILPLKGNLELVLFSEKGKIIEKKKISPNSNLCGIEIEAEIWHTFYSLDSEAFLIEIKKGPFEPILPEHFACWSPEEGNESVECFLEWMIKSRPNDTYNQK